MLRETTCANGVVCFRSSLLDAAGVPHAFSTRLGGVSTGIFSSLNLGNPSGPIRDAETNITENYRRFFSACGITDKQLCRIHQIHGNDILTLQRGDAPPVGKQADGLLSDDPSLVLSIRTADCVPVLLCNSTGRLVAAVHAGWRGVIAGILPLAIKAFQGRSIPCQDIFIAVGPCIGLDAFEVGNEVADQFDQAFPGKPVVRRQPGLKPHVDLRQAVLSQAHACGVPETNLDSDDLCTSRDEKWFFSHRRDQGLSGRLAAIISPGTPS